MKHLLTYSFRDGRAKCLMELVEALPGIVRDGMRTGTEARAGAQQAHSRKAGMGVLRGNRDQDDQKEEGRGGSSAKCSQMGKGQLMEDLNNQIEEFGLRSGFFRLGCGNK